MRPKPAFDAIRPMLDSEADLCEQILRSLPEWFGIEASIVEYRGDIEAMETCVAELAGKVVGFLTLNRHSDYSAEIHVMAVRKEQHGDGIGRAMVEYAEGRLKSQSVEYLQVKTLAPSRPNEHYARTRNFYCALGFRPLEENQLWGEANPCLVMIKHIA